MVVVLGSYSTECFESCSTPWVGSFFESAVSRGRGAKEVQTLIDNFTDKLLIVYQTNYHVSRQGLVHNSGELYS